MKCFCREVHVLEENNTWGVGPKKKKELGMYLTRIHVFACPVCYPSASIAQWIEHWSRKPGVVSSILTGGSSFTGHPKNLARF